MTEHNGKRFVAYRIDDDVASALERVRDHISTRGLTTVAANASMAQLGRWALLEYVQTLEGSKD